MTMKDDTDYDIIRAYFENKCELKSFPMELDHLRVHYKNNKLCIDDDPLEIVAVDHDVFITHEPFHEPINQGLNEDGSKQYIGPAKEGWQKKDKFMLMPKHNKEGLIAFIANRYAWGMNISSCYLDVQNKKVYMNKSCNYDNPEGIALRRTQCGLGTEIFLYYGDDMDGDLIKEDMCNVVHRVVDDGESHGMCSGWWNWENTVDDFTQLQKLLLK